MAADWHELMIPWRGMQPSTARVSGQVDPQRSTTDIPPPQSATLGLHPVARSNTTNCAKNYCNRTLIVKVIVENVVTCFLGHGVRICVYTSLVTGTLTVLMSELLTEPAVTK